MPMKRSVLLSTALVLVSWLSALSQSALAQTLNVLERGPHHKVVQTLTPVQEPDGTWGVQTNTYTQLETGLHYADDAGQWQEAAAQFEIVPGAAVAKRTQHKVILAPNANTDDAVQLWMPDGRRLASRVLGLGYFDRATGRSVVIAELQDSAGALTSAKDQVIYLNAFKGVSADLRYTLTKAGLEQDVILNEQPPGPDKFGLAPESSQLQAITEFFPESKPRIESRVLKPRPAAHQGEQGEQPDAIEAPTDVAAGNNGGPADGLAEPEIIDDTIEFESMVIGPGRAFGLWEESDVGHPARGVAVRKSWLEIEGRTILYEEVSYEDLRPLLESLPASPQASVGAKARVFASANRRLPQVKSTRRDPTQVIQVAQLALSRRAVVVDYLTINSTQTNCFFKGDTTYYITGPVTLNGTATTFGSGSVIKFSNTNAPKLSLNTPIVWQGTPYRIVTLTGSDDASVGETVTSNPFTGYYATTALEINATVAGASATLQHLRIVRAQTAIAINGRSGHVLSHGQFVNCQTGIAPSSADFSVRNGLFHNVGNVFSGASSTARGEHLTVNTASWFNANLGTCYLTNSLLVNVTNSGSYSGINNSTASGSGVLQTAGQGAHYLAAGSPYRNAGSTAINSTLASDLKSLTTFPPILWTADFTADTTLAPQAQRDTDTPDLGYHYCPLDYVWTTLNLTNATLTLTNGVAVGIYGTKGTTLRAGAKFISEGTPANLNHLVRYQAVQEQPVVWGAIGATMSLLDLNTSTPPEVRLRFTDVALLADTTSKRYMLQNSGSRVNPLAVGDSQLRGACVDIYSTSGTGMTVALNNNLAQDCSLSFYQIATSGYYAFTLTCYNNLFLNGNVVFNNQISSPAWTARDNLFDGVSVGTGLYAITASHNAYRNATSLGGTNNLTLAACDYQTGPLGQFYYPTSGANLFLLIDAGSRTREAAGLYHFTVKTAVNTKEGADALATVDIGCHYVGVGSDNLPKDTEGDGLPDYLEDRDGDNVVDAGETDWQTYNSKNGLTGSPGLSVFTPLK